jgi:uroporphyrinogen decarboxylase
MSRPSPRPVPSHPTQLLQVFDSWAGELAPREFRDFALPYLGRIATGVKEAIASRDLAPVPLCIFARGAHYALEDLATLQYDVVSLDWTVAPAQARARCGPHLTLQGNADPCLLYAPRDAIRAQVRDMLGAFGPARHIANLGHGMYPDHDPEQLRHYLEAIRDVSSEARASSKGDA